MIGGEQTKIKTRPTVPISTDYFKELVGLAHLGRHFSFDKHQTCMRETAEVAPILHFPYTLLAVLAEYPDGGEKGRTSAFSD